MNELTTTPYFQMLRLRDVSNLTTLSGMTIRRLIADQKFPEPIKLTERTTVWRSVDINNWIDERVKGGLND